MDKENLRELVALIDDMRRVKSTAELLGFKRLIRAYIRQDMNSSNAFREMLEVLESYRKVNHSSFDDKMRVHLILENEAATVAGFTEIVARKEFYVQINMKTGNPITLYLAGIKKVRNQLEKHTPASVNDKSYKVFALFQELSGLQPNMRSPLATHIFHGYGENLIIGMKEAKHFMGKLFDMFETTNYFCENLGIEKHISTLEEYPEKEALYDELIEHQIPKLEDIYAKLVVMSR